MLGFDLYFLKTNYENESPEYVFYNFIPIGLGFVIDEDIKNRFEKLNKLYFFILAISLLTIINFYSTVHVFNISVTTIFFIGIMLKVFITRLIAKKYNQSGKRITFKEQKELLLKQQKLGQSIFFLIFTIILLCFSITFLLSSKHSGFMLFLETVATIYYVLLFIWGLIILTFVYMSSKK